MAIVTSDEISAYAAVNGLALTAANLTWITTFQPAVEAAVRRFLGFNPASATYTEYHPVSQPNSVESDPLVQGYEVVGGQAYPYRLGDPSRSILALKNLPVRSIASVYENPAAWTTGAADGYFPSGTLIPATNYHLDLESYGTSAVCWTGHLLRNVGTWSAAQRSIKVTYVAGFSGEEIDSLFPEMKLAVCMTLCWHLLNAVALANMRQQGGPVASVAIEDFNVSFMSPVAYGLKLGGSASNRLPPTAAALLEPYVRMTQFIA